jgi:chemosensory pili system protein ChpC
MGQTAPAECQEIGEVNCLYVPLVETALLVPMSAVAEVVQSVQIKEQEGAPVWLEGWMEWRQKRVPLISFEALSGDSDNDKYPGTMDGSTALVMNTINPDKGLRYYAILAQGFSHLVRIAEDDPLKSVDNPGKLQHVLAQVELDDQLMQIPDLEGLEEYVSGSLQSFLKSL